jgi:hypothetical protein
MENTVVYWDSNSSVHRGSLLYDAGFLLTIAMLHATEVVHNMLNEEWTTAAQCNQIG